MIKNIILTGSLLLNTSLIYKYYAKEEQKEFIKEEIYQISKNVTEIIEDSDNMNINYEINTFKEKFTKITEEDRSGDYLNEILESQGFSNNTNRLLNIVYYEHLLGEIVVFDGKKIKFTKDFLDKNINSLNLNLISFLQFLMNIESNGGYKYSTNPKSSAKGPLQFLDGYMKNGIKHSKYSRKEGKYTSFETALRRTDAFYNNGKFNNFNGGNTPQYIIDIWDNGAKLDLNYFSGDMQIDLWIIDIIMRSNRSKKLIMGIMMGSTWSAKKMYNEIHHTNPNTNTNNLVNKNIYSIASNRVNLN